MTGAICSPETSPISESAAIRAAALDHLKRRIDWTALLGGELHQVPRLDLDEVPGNELIHWDLGFFTIA